MKKIKRKKRKRERGKKEKKRKKRNRGKKTGKIHEETREQYFQTKCVAVCFHFR